MPPLIKKYPASQAAYDEPTAQFKLRFHHSKRCVNGSSGLADLFLKK
jgi:hypothetical protein